MHGILHVEKINLFKVHEDLAVRLQSILANISPQSLYSNVVQGSEQGASLVIVIAAKTKHKTSLPRKYAR